MNAHTDRKKIRVRLGIVPQDDVLDFELTVEENLLIYGRYFGLPAKVIQERTASLLQFAQLSERAKDRVEPLSGGMKRRITFVRALINSPDILLLDEPTSTLDPIASQKIEDVIFKLKGRCTVLIVSHNMQQAARVSDTTAFFWLGKLVEVKETEQEN